MSQSAPSSAARPPDATGKTVIALVGSPNAGKTTLFNLLTGLRQKTGNYPGVTVERKEGTAYGQHGEPFHLIDLPGAYSLKAHSPDEEILRDVLLGQREDTPEPDIVIYVLDASNLQRNLYLATQVLELGLPTILVLNMMDVAAEQGLFPDPARLSETFGVPVIPMEAHRRKGVGELRIAMSAPSLKSSHHRVDFPEDLEAVLSSCPVPPGSDARAALYLPGLPEEASNWEDHLIAARYGSIQEICDVAVEQREPGKATLTERLDHYLLHKWLGPLAILVTLGVLFFLIFSVATYPMDRIDAGFAWSADQLTGLMPPGDLRDLLTKGVIAGVGGVVIFLPQILILFFFIGLMENTGYLSRVAFILDRLMSHVGLSGKSFVPLLSSYACAVPGVMGARTIENEKDRLITILVAPLASCSARLPVYLLMIAILIPTQRVPALTKSLYMLGLYVLGTLGVFFFAWLFNRIFKRGEVSHAVMELPTYKRPAFREILHHMLDRAWMFVRRAGTIILGISILLWAAETYPKSDSDDPSLQLASSFAGRMGHAIEPLIEPLGFDWKIGIGLVASFAAREIFVSAMSVTYHVEKGDSDEATASSLRDRMRQETRPDGTPVFTPLVCSGLMVFYVFAMQCMSTVVIVRRETNSWRWPLFQIAYMTGTGYLAALLVYQGGLLLGFS
ncbi:MAG: ferrous iron transport protein B [Verrucomicrobiales bacterium]